VTSAGQRGDNPSHLRLTAFITGSIARSHGIAILHSWLGRLVAIGGHAGSRPDPLPGSLGRSINRVGHCVRRGFPGKFHRVCRSHSAETRRRLRREAVLWNDLHGGGGIADRFSSGGFGQSNDLVGIRLSVLRGRIYPFGRRYFREWRKDRSPGRPAQDAIACCVSSPDEAHALSYIRGGHGRRRSDGRHNRERSQVGPTRETTVTGLQIGAYDHRAAHPRRSRRLESNLILQSLNTLQRGRLSRPRVHRELLLTRRPHSQLNALQIGEELSLGGERRDREFDPDTLPHLLGLEIGDGGRNVQQGRQGLSDISASAPQDCQEQQPFHRIYRLRS
jgi:hypothetical protein